MFLTA